MFKTYLTTAIRNLSRHKTNGIINIVGLMVGFAATIFGSLCIARLTVGYTAIAAARTNPVKSLRME